MSIREFGAAPSAATWLGAASVAVMTLGAPVHTAWGGPSGLPDVVGLTAQQISVGLAAGTYTSVELVEAYQKRIGQYEPAYNAFTTFNPDALSDAAALDAEYAATGPRGPLHGVPIVIKEAMDVKGLPSTAGYAPYAPQVGGVSLIPETDAPIVARLRAAGAIILGKTNIPAFSADGTRANSSWAGPTYNSYDRTIAPGASSSGTATAVSASFAVLGTAEETGGSIQNPAAAQSLVGIKPTFALVPNAGVAPLAGSTRDVVGMHAKTVYDAAITLDVIAGYTPEDPKTTAAIGKLPAGGYTSELSTTALQGKRLGLIGPGWRTGLTLTPETQALYDRAITTIQAEGATVVTDPFAGSGFAEFTPPSTGFESIVYDFEKFLERLGYAPSDNSLASLQEASGVNPFAEGEPLNFAGNLVPNFVDAIANPDVPPDLTTFFNGRQAYLDIYDRVLEENNLDALVFPQMFKPTPDLFSTDRIGATTVSEINLLGTPGVTVPAGYYSDGSPFSLIFLDKQFSEAELLGYAYDYEQATLLRVDPALVPLPSPLYGGAVALAFCGFAVARRRREEAAA